MVFSRNVLDLKSVHHRSQLDIHEPWVGEICQVLLVAQYCKQGLMVNAKNKVFNAKYEELAFFKTCDDSVTLAFDRMVSGFCPGIEFAAAVYCLPASFAAARSVSWALAPFLC